MNNNSIDFLSSQDSSQVFLDGELVGNIVEADAEKGYVDQIVKKVSPVGWIDERVRRYGRVRILFNGIEAVAVVQMAGDM